MGLDISSKTIGWGILDVNIETKEIKYIDSGIYHPLKKGHLIEKLSHTREAIIDIIYEYNPDEIVIEDILLYIANRSTAKTIVCLATFNRMICLLAYDYLNKIPNLISVSNIRKSIKLNKKDKMPIKEEIPEIIEKRLNIKFPYYYNTRGKDKGKKIHISSYDRSDALACALSFALDMNKK